MKFLSNSWWHSTNRSSQPHLHLCWTCAKHGGQSPSWHRFSQKWDLQERSFPQISEQVGIGSKQLLLSSTSFVFPQWQSLIFPGSNSHSPQSPGWQIFRQRWFPHRSLWPQTSLQEKSPLPGLLPGSPPHSTASVFLPQKQAALRSFSQEPQAPAWQDCSQA